MKKNINIVMLGDSLIARGDWKKLLEVEELLNFGMDGDTTLDLLNRLEPIIQLQPKRVFLMIGINDLSVSIPLEEAFSNYKKIVEKLITNNIEVIVQFLLVTQMPAINKKVKLFNELIIKYSKQKNLQFIDLNSSFKNEKELLREDLTTDGLHLGQKAYKAWAYKLKQFI